MTAEEIAARLPRDAVHQGLLLEAEPLAPLDISELPEKGLVVVLDQITDPHNVGAILRTCAAFAVDALLTTERHSPEFRARSPRRPAAASSTCRSATVTNLARALEELGDLGYWRVGLDSEAPAVFGAAPLAAAAGAGARRRGQGPAPADAREMRRTGAARPARRDQEPQRLQRLRHRAGAGDPRALLESAGTILRDVRSQAFVAQRIELRAFGRVEGARARAGRRDGDGTGGAGSGAGEIGVDDLPSP